MTINYIQRRNNLRELLQEKNLDGLLITNLINIRYLSGFSGSNATLYISADTLENDYITTDGRYTSQINKQVSGINIIISPARFDDIFYKISGSKRVGLEENNLTWGDFNSLNSAFKNIDFISSNQLVESLRIIKDDSELGLIKKACEISVKALSSLISKNIIRPGKTEVEIARALEWEMFNHGAESLAFPTIVASGYNSAIPHHSPTDKIIESGDFLKIDFGALYAGYNADITRTFVIEKISDWQKEIYDIVKNAQQAGVDAVKSGISLSDVDLVSRELIVKAGFGEFFVHGLGHGVGLEVHEAPTVSFRSMDISKKSQIITVEPGIYLPGKGGVRIEDTMLVEDQKANVFTNYSKDLQII